MKRSYLDYAMSVIVARALPDVRDGLKPVQRRILYAMHEAGYEAGKPHRKSARIVGDVMGKYHPHGDAAIYEAMVRMAQDFTMRLPLVDGQGNFGSMDGDPPAAMRYTEARLARAADALLADIDKDTVDFRPNYDESAQEPVVLPARFPNLLVNGAGGIAVGMATNIPPHNPGEVIDAAIALIERPEITALELCDIVAGPDFPTGGIILGRQGIVRAYASEDPESRGRGTIVVRGKAHIEEFKGRQAIVVTEIPYLVNKAKMVERIAEVVREKKVEGIADLRDESDRHGVRVVIELKREVDAEVVLNQLYKYTPLQTTFGINMVALVGGRPQSLDLKSVLEAFLSFREEVVSRRTAFELARARERAHVLLGLAAAVADLDAVIELVRRAPSPEAAKEELMARSWPAAAIAPLLALLVPEEGERAPEADGFRLSERQAQAILELALRRLTGLEREKIRAELEEIASKIEELRAILRSREKLLEVIKGELLAFKEQFASPRRTVIDTETEPDQDIEDLIQREDMVVTVTLRGYIKRVPLSTFRAQRRGGKGRTGVRPHEDDAVTRLFVASTHTPVLFFTSRGRVYKLKVYRLPLGAPQARGRPMVQLFPGLEEGETITAVAPLPEDESAWEGLSIVFATARGNVRRNELADFLRVPATGKIAMGLEEGDRLVGAEVAREDQDVLLASLMGKVIRFPVRSLRIFKSRTSEGVIGMELAPGDAVVSMSLLEHVEATPEEREDYLRWAAARRRGNGEEEGQGEPFEPVILAPDRLDELARKEEFVLAVTENGYGKRSSAFEYRITRRGGQGIIGIETSARNGLVAATFPVAETDHVLLVTDQGRMIRIPAAQIRIASRNTQGVRLLEVGEGERVVAAVRLPEAENGVGQEGEEGAERAAEP
ncbi:MAG: DNA gyrase subunit A [Geminicoccaceae bacterium]|nr:DNA gyrase subunit A [Geminicoccaceae bacterium]MCS7268126.1 DNA gyrase subunit A [Geminicoccaceae bacterium]MDW8125050.1 DNA gyrase subunit A [Geminicoccaceae bacterium]MDW8342038.1 DNA gyrase subunit A [Geminicoccaceae bacterium]